MFKRVLGFAVLLIACSAAWGSGPERQRDAVWIHYRSPSVTVSTVAVIVDLSDTVNWPHKTARAARVLGWRAEVDGVAAGTSTIKLGVVTDIGLTTGTVNWFYTKSLTLNVSGTTKLDPIMLMPAEVNTMVTANQTPYILGSENTIASSADAILFQSTTTLPSARGNNVVVAPAIGDVVMEVVGGGANAVLATLDLLYLTIP